MRDPVATAPTVQEMLDFLVMLASHPYRLSMGGVGSSARPADKEWMLLYSSKSTHHAKDREGCVYAPTQHGVIAKAMRLWAAQEAAERLIAEAQK